MAGRPGSATGDQNRDIPGLLRRLVDRITEPANADSSDDSTDYRQLPRPEEQVSSLVEGLSCITRYRRKVGVYDNVLTGTGGYLSPNRFGSSHSGYDGPKDIEQPPSEVAEWQRDREHLVFTDAKYDIDPDTSRLSLHVTARPEPDADVPVGRYGNLKITGRIPDEDPATFIDRHLSA